jgi:NAD(P)-dependent dehydrogenase (short-subunit alcohol dehydrogenase family)
LFTTSAARPRQGGGYAALTDEDWFAALNANLLSAMRLDRVLVPAMIDRAAASSFTCRPSDACCRSTSRPSPTRLPKPRSATTARHYPREVGPKGIRVLRVSPGFTETDAATRLIERLASLNGTDTMAAHEALMRSRGGIPIGRPNTPAEVADLIAFLASNRATTLHGAEYVIDGGTVPTV